VDKIKTLNQGRDCSANQRAGRTKTGEAETGKPVSLGWTWKWWKDDTCFVIIL